MLIISSIPVRIVLQQKEGHLLNLQANLPPISKSESKTRIWTRKPHQPWDVRFHSAKDWVPPLLPDFDTLLSSWFSYAICMMAPILSDIFIGFGQISHMKKKASVFAMAVLYRVPPNQKQPCV